LAGSYDTTTDATLAFDDVVSIVMKMELFWLAIRGVEGGVKESVTVPEEVTSLIAMGVGLIVLLKSSQPPNPKTVKMRKRGVRFNFFLVLDIVSTEECF
jgi:hypothetical protein